MSHTNPFESTLPAPKPEVQPVFPLQLAAVVVGCAALMLALSIVLKMMKDGFDISVLWRYLIPFGLSSFLLSGVAVYWLAQGYMARHLLASYRHPWRFLISYGALYMLLSTGLGVVTAQLYMWMNLRFGFYDSGRVWMSLSMWCISLFSAGLKLLLALWLLLHLFRSKASAACDGRVMWYVPAACFALGVAAAYLQLNVLGAQMMMNLELIDIDNAQLQLVSVVQAVLYGAVAFWAARAVLPQQVEHFNGGRLLLALLMMLGLWVGSAVIGLFMILRWYIYVSTEVSVFLWLLAFVQIGLVWPYTAFGFERGYQAQAAS